MESKTSTKPVIQKLGLKSNHKAVFLNMAMSRLLWKKRKAYSLGIPKKKLAHGVSQTEEEYAYGRRYTKCRVPSDSEHGISESKMAIGRRENLPGGRDGQTESMERREALPDRERGAEPKGASGTNR